MRAGAGSPGSRAWRFRTCPGSLTTRGPTAPRDTAAADVAFRHSDSVGTPEFTFRGSIARPARAPVNASPPPSQTTTHDSGPPWVATLSTWSSFISSSMPVYPGAPECVTEPLIVTVNTLSRRTGRPRRSNRSIRGADDYQEVSTWCERRPHRRAATGHSRGGNDDAGSDPWLGGCSWRGTSCREGGEPHSLTFRGTAVRCASRSRTVGRG